jgi:hypothetical protein
MDILVAEEETGVVRDAFIAFGHNAMSCDLKPSRRPGPHYRGDIKDVLYEKWDMLIFFAPCTYSANSGVKHLYIDGRKENGRNEERWKLMQKGAEFFKMHLECAHIPMIVGENPIPHKYALEIMGRKYDQIIQPWQFGHGERKATCLWLKNVPKLVPTNIVEGKEQRIWKMAPSPDRGAKRSETFQGIADAMAAQWSCLKP